MLVFHAIKISREGGKRISREVSSLISSAELMKLKSVLQLTQDKLIRDDAQGTEAGKIKNAETNKLFPHLKSGGDRSRTGVQTYSPKAFYMFILALIVGK